ncbi:parotid secretory protein [Cricetulus griseus]|uniref:Parotid secretory protein n=1 Tax=Cricetulus griseus TaxID=10029 RepID=A0A061I105_CRIGR|nr:parotid secretory protein [Cricetulus griseus]
MEQSYSGFPAVSLGSMSNPLLRKAVSVGFSSLVSGSKMFQIGSLVVFCSLLTGTSESHFGSIGSSLNNLYNLNSVSEEETLESREL